MRLLVLGGTMFLGRHIVAAALARGHEVTLFNRGQQNPDLFPDVEKLRGDRDANLTALAGRTWDAVVDTCGYVPRIVGASAELLADAVEHYTFISSISVYAEPYGPNMDEAAPTGTLEHESVEEVTGEAYGPLKALCEQSVLVAMGGRAFIVRAGLIVGSHDPTDRFTYWPARINKGGEVLAPGVGFQCTQFVDVRDLAEWTIRMAEHRQAGIYNATGPAGGHTLQHVLEECRAVTGGAAEFIWAGDDFLSENEVGAFVEMPLWVPADEAGILCVDVTKAVDSGLKFRQLSNTIRHTLEWAQKRPVDYEWKAGLTAERETELLEILRQG